MYRSINKRIDWSGIVGHLLEFDGATFYLFNFAMYNSHPSLQVNKNDETSHSNQSWKIN